MITFGYTQFIDSPSLEDMVQTVNKWHKPVAPLKLMPPLSDNLSFWETGNLAHQYIEKSQSLYLRTRQEKLTLNWLYDFIRLNVKRGRVFDLREVLESSQADCLGYAKLFSVLGIHWGLDAGVVEVVIDNRGQTVPHTASLVKLASGSNQFVDFWYGCRNIQHLRLGLNVRRSGRWQVEDIEFSGIKEAEDISYLPEEYVDSITLYIQGNRSLKEGHYSQAIEQYSQSIRLYPQNTRVYYNRAIACEKIGKTEEAQIDYARALQDEYSILRTLATQPEDVVDLIRLDSENMAESDQQDYLRRHGFHKGCFK